MFTAELKINGALLAVLYGHNEGYTGADDTCRYTIHYHNIGAGTVESGEVLHARNHPHGLAAVVHAALTAVIGAEP